MESCHIFCFLSMTLSSSSSCVAMVFWSHHPSTIDGKRCAATVQELFQKAKEPDKIVIGLVEQNTEEDLFCLEGYCKEHGIDIYKKETIRADTTKIIAKDQRKDCPRIDQIRKLAIQNYGAKGPSYARSMVRKILGNEEFCLQIDAHTQVVQDWDVLLKQEWERAGNEFGIISTVPAALGEKDTPSVPRQCAVEFQDVGVPVRTFGFVFFYFVFVFFFPSIDGD